MHSNITNEMIDLLNSGDRRELRAFLKTYSRPIFERALARCLIAEDAKHVTARVMSQSALLAAKGELRYDIDAQMMELTDACCSEDMFFEQLVDDTMRELGNVDAYDKALYEEASRRLYEAPAAPRAEPAPEPLPEAAPMAYAPPADTAYAAPAPCAAPAKEPIPSLFDEDEEDDDFEKDFSKASPWLVVIIFLLSILVVALVWVLLVKLMHIGVLPMFDFGFGNWFNENLFIMY